MLKRVSMVMILLAVLLNVGCSSGSKPQEGAQASSSSEVESNNANADTNAAQKTEEINVMVRAGVLYNAFTSLTDDFEKETGIKVNVQEVGRDGYLQKVTTQILGQGSSNDIVLILNNYIGQFAASGQFEPLGKYIENNDDNIDRFMPATIEAVKYQDEIYALPVAVSSMMLYYRKDLIDSPPTTWEEYKEVAKKFTQSINPQSPTEFGATFQGKRGETQPKEWYQYFWSFGGQMFDDQLKPQFNSDAGVQALTFVVDNYRKDKIYPPDITTYEYPEVLSAFQNGKVAMAVEWEPAYGDLLNPEKSPLVHDKVAITDLPEGTPFTHTWTLALLSTSQHKEAAYKFMSWLTNEGAKRYALAGGIPPVREVLQDEEVIKEQPVFPALLSSLEKAKAEPNLPEWPPIHELMTEAITVALAGEKSPKDALDDANRKIHNLLESRGYYK